MTEVIDNCPSVCAKPGCDDLVGIACTNTRPPFSPDALPDKDLVWDTVELNRVIYDVNDEKPASDVLNEELPKFELIQWIDAGISLEAMIVTSRCTPPIVVFRGSEDAEDWAVNAHFDLQKLTFVNAPPDVEVHQGFQLAVTQPLITGRSVLEEVGETLVNLVGVSGEVVITGHSLG